MGVIILMVMGAIFGWLAAIISQTETLGAAGSNIAAGAVGALVIGEIASPDSLSDGLSVPALLLAIIGALLFISVASFIRSKV